MAIAFNISYITSIDKNQIALFDSVFADWNNVPYDGDKFNVGSSKSMAFNELIVLDANLTTKDGKKQGPVVNKCPTYAEYHKVDVSKMSAEDQHNIAIDYVPLIDQQWFGM